MLLRLFLAHVTRTIAMILAIVVGLFFVINLLDNLGDAGGALAAVQASLLEIPAIVHAVLPASAALGGAVALALLDGRREMVLLRLSGISRLRLAGWLLLCSSLWVIGHLAFTELVLPEASKVSRNLEIKRSGSLITADEQIWLRTGDGFASVGYLTPDGSRVEDLWLFSREGAQLDRVRWAQVAAHADGAWTLYDVRVATLADGSWEFDRASSQPWPHGPDPELFVSFSIPPQNLPFGKLLELSAALAALQENTNAIDLIIWSRLFDALAIAVLMVATLLLVRYRTSASAGGVRVTAVVALVAVLLFHYFQLIVRQFGVEQDWLGLVGAALPLALAAAGLGALALWRELPPAARRRPQAGDG